MKITNFFDEEFYLRWVKNAPPLVKDFLKKEEEFLRDFLQHDMTVLDVGCGYGRTISKIASIVKRIYGIDNSFRMVERARENLKHHNNIEIYLQDAINMGFDDNSIDICLCMANTFGNFNDKKLPILYEMKRVTKVGGTIIISVFSEEALPYRIESYKNAGMDILDVGNDGTVLSNDGLKLEQFKEEDLKELSKRLGLKSEIKSLNNISYLCILNK